MTGEFFQTTPKQHCVLDANWQFQPLYILYSPDRDFALLKINVAQLLYTIKLSHTETCCYHNMSTSSYSEICG